MSIVAGRKLDNSKLTVYWPDGRPLIEYTPFTSVTAVRTP